MLPAVATNAIVVHWPIIYRCRRPSRRVPAFITSLLALCPRSTSHYHTSVQPPPAIPPIPTPAAVTPTTLPLRHLPRRSRLDTSHPPSTMAGRTRSGSKPALRENGSGLDNLDTALLPQVQLRRSNRRLGKPVHQGGDTSIQENIMGIRAQGDENLDGADVQDSKDAVKGGLQAALEGLVQMEQRLRRETKKQKLQVEESRFSASYQVGSTADPTTAKDASLKAMEPVQQRGQQPTSDGDKLDASRIDASRIDAPEESRAARAPPVNSSYLPLPWRGRLGYACLNTYLRSAKTPVFSSRTCRIATIIDHRHPLTDPSQPEHPVKNRPDKSKTAQAELGHKFVQEIGLANARDIIKMLRWNDKYGIKFMRLSSEMFPFASHLEHGYRLAPFASKVLAEVGRVAAELGHRLTTHPGQFTQLGSPRKEVVEAAIRDLEYHDEMLSLLKLPDQQNRDAVMILHMGGIFGDKAATLDRFRRNYAGLSPSVKARLVLENDDVGWSVHDLLPVCEELNIPLVLDYHHHNIVFDSTQCREGTCDISQPDIQERIAATWRRKGIKQKMHYSEPCPGAVTPRDRRRHSPRVATLPPCAPDMDLMIEAKDKEQAVFELMRNFRLPGFEKINDMIPHERDDEPRPAPTVPKRRQKPAANALKRKRAADEDDPVELDDAGAGAQDQSQDTGARLVPDEEVSMGGPDNRVYWPPGMEEWLKPRRKGARVVKPVELAEEDDEC
ncbi:hypothetical protein VTK26DRAFT_3370 [Humicola hyalothermophila]